MKSCEQGLITKKCISTHVYVCSPTPKGINNYSILMQNAPIIAFQFL